MERITSLNPFNSILPSNFFTDCLQRAVRTFVILVTLFAVVLVSSSAEAGNPSETLSFLQEFRKSISGVSDPENASEHPDKVIQIKVSIETADALPEHTEIFHEIKGDQLNYILKVDQHALANPTLLVARLLELQAITGASLISTVPDFYYMMLGPTAMLNHLNDAKLGDESAKLFLKKLRRELLVKAKFTQQFVDDFKFMADLKTSVEAQKVLKQFIAAEILKIDSEILQLRAKLSSEFKTKFAVWKASVANLHFTKDLDYMVANNDREGVKQIVELIIPWSLLRPSEIAAWKIWLEAIVSPDPAKTFYAYRGVTDRGALQKFPIEQSQRASNMRSIKTFIASFESNLNSRSPEIPFKQGEDPFTISARYHEHASNSEKSNFLSFTTDVAQAQYFAGTGVIVAKIDSRRFIPNLNNVAESEVLASLVVFPDEILASLTGEGWVTKLYEMEKQLSAKQTNPKFSESGLGFYANVGLRCKALFP